MLNRIFVVDSVTLTSTGTAVSTYTPWDQTTRKLPTQVVVKATGQGAYVRLSSDASAATNADVLVQAGDHVVLSVQGRRWVSVLSDGASSTVNVGALSTGVSGSAASLDLAFAGVSALDSRITFTRASTGTFTGSNGLIQSAAINAPRFDYDPVTLAAKGLLIEEQRTNLLTYSEDFSNAAWVKVAGSVSVSQNAVGPNGVSNSGTTVTALVGTNNHWLYQSFASSAIAYSQSVYAKAGTANWIGIGFGSGATTDGVFFNLSNGTVGTAAFGSTGNIQNVGNGWYRCTVTRTGPGGTYFGALEVHTADNQALNWNAAGTETILVFGLNMEAGSFATSYIPTVASQVTRSADVAAVNTLSPWYNATEGTLYAEATAYAGTTTNRYYELSDGTSANVIQSFAGPSTIYTEWVYVGGVPQAQLSSSGSPTSLTKIAAAYKQNDFAASLNGATPATDTSGAIPSVNKLNIGSASNGSSNLNGHIRRITYYPRRLSNAELQAITA